MSLINYKKKQNYEAISNARKALSIYLFNHDWQRLAPIYNLLGVLFWQKKNYSDALNYLKKAEEVATLKNLDSVKEQVFHNFGLIYKDRKKYDLAIKYLKKAINLKISNNRTNIITSYYSLIDCLLSQENLKDAKNLLTEAYAYCNSEKDYHLLNTLKALISRIEGEYKSFLETLKNSIDFFEKQNDYIQLKELHEVLAEFYYQNRKYKLASQHYKKQLELYKALYD